MSNIFEGFDQFVENLTAEKFMELYDPILWAIRMVRQPFNRIQGNLPIIVDEVMGFEYKPCDIYSIRHPIKDGILIIGCIERKEGFFSRKKIASISVGIENNNILRIIQHYIGTNVYCELMQEWNPCGKAGNWTTGFRPISKPIFFSHEVGRRKMAEIIIKFFNDRAPAQDFERRWIEERELCRKRREWTPQE